MTAIKIILFCVGAFLIATAFCGALMVAGSDQLSKDAVKLYRWLLFIGVAVIIAALLVTIFL